MDGDAETTPCPRATDVVRRMDFAVASAYHHGTRAMRTHLDGTNSPDAKLRATVYRAFRGQLTDGSSPDLARNVLSQSDVRIRLPDCRARWAAKGMHLQGVANLYLPLWRDNALAERHVDEAVQ